MKGMVGLALLLVGIGIVYVLVRRPTPAKQVTGASTSNQLFGVLGSIGNNIVGAFANGGTKIGAPSAVTGATSPIINDGTYQTSGSADVEGNTLVNDAGQTLTYGTD